MQLSEWSSPSLFSLLILWILSRGDRAASQAAGEGTAISKRVSDSCRYYGAAAQSKTPSVGHLGKKRTKTSPGEAETTRLPSQLHSVHHGYRAKASDYSHVLLTSFLLRLLFIRVKATLHWRSSSIRANSGPVAQCLLKCVVLCTKAPCTSVCTTAEVPPVHSGGVTSALRLHKTRLWTS